MEPRHSHGPVSTPAKQSGQCEWSHGTRSGPFLLMIGRALKGADGIRATENGDFTEATFSYTAPAWRPINV